MAWEIRVGDALERLREMPDESVQCCVTSPPYWGLRDYGVNGQLGLEDTPQEFVAKMVEVFAEVRRVLRAGGTCWVNIGDSYAGSWGAQSRGNTNGEASSTLEGSSPLSARQIAAHPKGQVGTDSLKRTPGCKPKDLVGVPWMLAFALRADGWYLRAENIWNKPNPMPESVLDRPTRAHEQLFLLSKSPRYFYDAEAIREQATWAGPHSPAKSPYGQGFASRSHEEERRRQDKQRGHGRRHDGFNDRWDAMTREEQQALGRNKRSVWTIATRPYPDAHFATFPPDLAEPCILAGTPPKACGECGAPWVRKTERFPTGQMQKMADGWDTGAGGHGSFHRDGREKGEGGIPVMATITTGWQPTCDHEDDSGRAVVLDPFAGAGTTPLVSTQLGRDSIGIELNPSYAEMAEDRIRRWEANPAGHLKSKPLELVGQGSLLDPVPEGEVA